MFKAPGTRSYCSIRTVAWAGSLQIALPFLPQVNSLVIVAILHSPFRALQFNYYDSVCGVCSYLGLYRVITLSDNYHLSLPAAAQPWVQAVGWVGEVSTINLPKGSENRQLSRKIMAVWKVRSYSAASTLKVFHWRFTIKISFFMFSVFWSGGKFILT